MGRYLDSRLTSMTAIEYTTVQKHSLDAIKVFFLELGLMLAPEHFGVHGAPAEVATGQLRHVHLK